MAARRRSPAAKGRRWKAAPCADDLRGLGECPQQGRERHRIRPRLVPDLRGAAGNPNIAEELKKGKQLAIAPTKVYLDGLQPVGPGHRKGRRSARDPLLHREHTLRGAGRRLQYRFTDQPSGWLGATLKVDWHDPGQSPSGPVRADRHVQRQDGGSISYYNWFVYQFWRFQFVQQEVAKVAQTAIEFPPCRRARASI